MADLTTTALRISNDWDAVVHSCPVHGEGLGENFTWPKCEIPTPNDREAGCTGKCDLFVVVPLATRQEVEAERDHLLKRVGGEMAQLLQENPDRTDAQLATLLKLQISQVKKAMPFAELLLASAR